MVVVAVTVKGMIRADGETRGNGGSSSGVSSSGGGSCSGVSRDGFL